MRSLLINSVLLAIFLFSIGINGKVLLVPQDYSTIQAAINAAVKGDTVLVAEGRYYENINFLGKKILVTSMFLNDHDVSFIPTTIIDGSKPGNPDKASCVLMVSGEDSSSILQGFTLTGGKGTKWVDEHGAGTYVEGGGILTTLSSPTIRFNYIINNEAIATPTGTTSAGGGAIRCGDGSPHIYNNVILNNTGMYGGGIVLNYCSGARIVNNIIDANKVYQAVTGKQTFGGGGIWVYESKPGNTLPNSIENNTITGNSSNTVGGGIRIWSALAEIKNNIVWSNFQKEGIQIHLADAVPIINYNDMEDYLEGVGNVNLFPEFTDSGFLLKDDSPCIDYGDSATQFNDPEDLGNPGFALSPSKGKLRNNIGVYGGAGSKAFWNFSTRRVMLNQDAYDFGLALPGIIQKFSIPIFNVGASPLRIDSLIIGEKKTEITFQNVVPLVISTAQKGELLLSWNPVTNEDFIDTLFIYHNQPDIASPYKVALKGNSFPNALVTFDATSVNFGDIDVNTPTIDTTVYVHNIGTAFDSIYVSLIYQVVKPDSAIAYHPKNSRFCQKIPLVFILPFSRQELKERHLIFISLQSCLTQSFQPE